MVVPVPGKTVGTPYGRRGSYWSCQRDAYGNGIHTGVDYPAATGTPVVAARPGTARYCNHGSAFGNHQLEIRCGDGTRDFYAHMTTRSVSDGAKVSAGQTVGKVGAEGNVTGPHLHFERHATESGGWSCSVVRDPAPSINYQPSGGGSGGGAAAGGGGKEDMPTYGKALLSKSLTIKPGEWAPLSWDDPKSGDMFNKGNPGIALGGRQYVATIVVNVPNRDGATFSTDWVELDEKTNERKEQNPSVNHDRDWAIDTRAGYVSKGRRLRARVRNNGDRPVTLKSAEINLLTW